MRRIVIPELLDSDAGSAAQIQAALGDLRRINRWFGGTKTLAACLGQVVQRSGRRELSLLDVAAGPAEASLGAAALLRRRGIRVSVTLLDRAVTHINSNVNNAVGGDALALPFHDESFDVVTCSLFLHHLEPDQVVAFVNEALRVCRVAVIINDLRRSAAHLALVYAGFPLFRSVITRHDAPASVRRSYTPDEVAGLLARTRAVASEIEAHFLCRFGAVAWKEPRA